MRTQTTKRKATYTRAGSGRSRGRSGKSCGKRCSVACEVGMKVYVIGAGPGDPKLITVRGAELVAGCPVVLYTGSLVPREVVETARADALVLDSSGVTLDEIVEVVARARDADQDVARVHTGDPT